MHRRKLIRSLSAGGMAVSPLFSKHSAKPNTAKKRILVAHFYDETNTFIPERRTLEEVKKNALFGNDFLRVGGMVHGTVGTALDGFVDCCELFDVELIGSIFVEGNHRMMTKEVFDFTTGYILDVLDKVEVDGIFISFHGAGVTEGHDDLEGDTLELIRAKVGPDVPITFAMDLHCTLTKKMIQYGDGVSVYRTYPHIDAFETGFEAGLILMGSLVGKTKPVLALSKLPLMIGPPLNVLTGDEPMKKVYDRARFLQRTVPGIISVCPAHGFMQQDVPEQGAGVIVTADRDRDLAQRTADEIADLMFSFRKSYWTEIPSVKDALALAVKSDRPVAIADSGDNIGAGGAGDGTHLLQAVLEQGITGVFVQIYDPESAMIAYQAGVNSPVKLSVGGKSHHSNGQPVVVNGIVKQISEEGHPWHPCARVESGGVTLLLNTKRIGPNDQANVRAMGIEPEKFRISVCKGGFAFRPQYSPAVFEHILCATPGYSSPDLTTFQWKKIPGPIYPLSDF